MAAEAITQRKTLFRTLTILFAVAALLAVVIPASSAPKAPPNKVYEAVLSPTSGPGGTGTNFQLTITNKTSSQVAGSANVTLPSGFTIVGNPTIISVSNGKTWSSTKNGNVIELRNPGPSTTNALTTDESVTVGFTATTPCAPGGHTIDVVVKQSNDFNGVGNNLGGGNPTFTVTTGCAHHLAFTASPPATGSLAGQPLSTVTVQVKDSANNNVSLAGLAITVCISNATQNGCSSQTLYGNAPKATGAGGSASFTDLIIAQDTPDQTYRLRAVAATNPPSPATSNPFEVAGTAIACVGGPCNDNFGDPENATRGRFSGAVLSNTSECSDCFLTIAESTLAPSDCPDGYQCRVGVTFLYVPPQNAEGPITLLVSCDKKDCAGTGVANFRLWLEKPNVAEPIELFPCGSPVVTPCIDKRNRTGVGDMQWVVLVDKDDPRPLG